MSEQILQQTYNGQEFTTANQNTVGAVAGLADDHVLAELLRLSPFDGTNTYKAVLPYSQPTQFRNVPYPAGVGLGIGTVQPTGSAANSINIMPFRMVVGSRTAAATNPPGDASLDTGAMANWRDIRSGVFVGSATTLAQTITIAASGGSHARWDLVYATLAVDSNGPSVNVRVKDPTSGNISVQSAPSYLTSPVSVTVVKGVEDGTFAFPALPADSGGNYNVALAYVRVVTTATGTYKFLAEDIRAVIVGGLGAFIRGTSGELTPANGNNDANNSASAGANEFNDSGTTTSPSMYYTPATSGTRPPLFFSPDWVGKVERFVLVDNSTTSAPAAGNCSHIAGGVIDSSVDWRNRFFKVTIVVTGNAQAAGTPPAEPTVAPFPMAATKNATVQMGNSFYLDGTLQVPTAAQTASCIAFCNSTATPGVAGMLDSPATCGIYVDSTTGNLLWSTTTAPAEAFLFFWIEATGQRPNAPAPGTYT